MLRKIQTLNRAYIINWTPESVTQWLLNESITANQLIQTNSYNTHKLIRDLFLLACQAAIRNQNPESKQADLLSHYAKLIRQINRDYQKLFRRTVMNEVDKDSTNNDASINSIDRLQARLFYLITQYSLHPCKHLAANIVNQLTCLCQHPHIELLPAQHYIYSQSINLWRSKLIQDNGQQSIRQLH